MIDWVSFLYCFLHSCQVLKKNCKSSRQMGYIIPKRRRRDRSFFDIETSRWVFSEVLYFPHQKRSFWGCAASIYKVMRGDIWLAMPSDDSTPLRSPFSLYTLWIYIMSPLYREILFSLSLVCILVCLIRCHPAEKGPRLSLFSYITQQNL